MRILQIAPPWINIPPKTYGGTETVIHTLIEQLIVEGHDVTLFATGGAKTSAKLKYVYEKALFEQNEAEWSLIQPALALPALVHYDQAFKEAATGKYDMVHAHLSAGTDLIKLKFLSELTVPYIATTHMIFPFDKWSNKDDEYIKYYAKNIQLVCISHAQARLYPKEFNQLGVVYNSLNLNEIHFQNKPNGKNDPPYLTWLGKIMPWKGVDLAIKAAQQTNMRLIFAGVLDETNHPESIAYFKEQVEPFIDGDQIQFLGPADLAMKNDLLGNATAFLNPISWAEPFGMVSIEAMATGTPVISFKAGGPTEIIQEGQNGFLVEDLDEMVQAISQIPSLNRRNVRQSVERRFSAKAMATGYVKMYQKVLAQNKLNQSLESKLTFSKQQKAVGTFKNLETKNLIQNYGKEG